MAAATSLMGADVCVVGAGPAGQLVASGLAAAGLDVMMIEAGGREASRVAGVNVGLDYPLERSRAAGIGGSSLRWMLDPGHRVRPLDRIDFQRRDWVRPSGWPLSYEDLKPYIDQAWGALGRHAGASPLLDESDPMDEVIEHSDRLVAQYYWFSPPRHFASDDPNRADSGAPLPARGQTGGARVLEALSVTDISLTEDGTSVSSLSVRDAAGRQHTVAADLFVLAAGGIENARLLLASPGRTGAGVGNEHDLVGRYFQEHPHLVVGYLVPFDCGQVAALSSWRDVDGVIIERWVVS